MFSSRTARGLHRQKNKNYSCLYRLKPRGNTDGTSRVLRCQSLSLQSMIWLHTRLFIRLVSILLSLVAVCCYMYITLYTRFELNSSNGLYIIDESTTREMQCKRNTVRALRFEASSQYHQLWCAVSCRECPVSLHTPYSLPPQCSLGLCGWVCVGVDIYSVYM